MYADNSNMTDYFNSYVEAVKSVTNGAAGTIDFIKESVYYTGVWIEYGSIGGDVLLQVTDNEDRLFVKADSYTSVCRRYTDENGDNVYEITIFHSKCGRLLWTCICKITIVEII